MTTFQGKDVWRCFGLFVSDESRIKASIEKLKIQATAHDVRLFGLRKEVEVLEAQKADAKRNGAEHVFRSAVMAKHSKVRMIQKYETLRDSCLRAIEAQQDEADVRGTVQALMSVPHIQSSKMDKTLVQLDMVTDRLSAFRDDVNDTHRAFSQSFASAGGHADEAELMAELEEFISSDTPAASAVQWKERPAPEPARAIADAYAAVGVPVSRVFAS